MKHIFTVRFETAHDSSFHIVKFEAKDSYEVSQLVHTVDFIWDSYVIQFVAKRWPVYEMGQYVGHFTEAEALAAKKRPGSWPARKELGTYDMSPDQAKAVQDWKEFLSK